MNHHITAGLVKSHFRAGDFSEVVKEYIVCALVFSNFGNRSVVKAAVGYQNNPANAVGLYDRGQIRVGNKANLVTVDDKFDILGVYLNGKRVR